MEVGKKANLKTQIRFYWGDDNVTAVKVKETGLKKGEGWSVYDAGNGF